MAGRSKRTATLLSKRQAKLVTELKKPQSDKAAMIAAGYSPATADKSSNSTIARIEKTLRVAFTDVGLTTMKLAEQIKEGCEAEIPGVGKIKARPDWPARSSYHRMVTKIRGDEAPDKVLHVMIDPSHLKALSERSLSRVVDWIDDEDDTE